MRQRKSASYTAGYLAALNELKSNLFEEAERRNGEREPFTLATLSESVMDTINAQIDRHLNGLKP